MWKPNQKVLGSGTGRSSVNKLESDTPDIKLASICVALHSVHMHLHTQADKHMQRKSLESQITSVKENK